MPLIVKVTKHNKRTALLICSGYREGNLMEDSAGIQYFSNKQNAIDWAVETGYTVISDNSTTLVQKQSPFPTNCDVYIPKNKKG